MNGKVTIEIIDTMALRFLRDLASISLIRFTPENMPDDEETTALINKICTEVETSLEPCLMAAQVEAIGKEDW